MKFDWLRGRQESRGATVAVWVNLALLLVAVVGLLVDKRHILGLNPWVKPLKFDVSAIIYLETMAWMLAKLHTFRRTRIVTAWGLGIAMIVENGIISLQSLRGVPSHMNYTSLFNGAAFGTMGIFILINTILVALVLLLYCSRRTGLAPGLLWGIRLGLFMLLAGSIEGVRMVMHGGHTIGANDGLAGLPLVNWSTGHGDLRVAHFFALHALQALPLAGWLVSRQGWPSAAQVATMLVVFAGYATAVWWLFAQALAGRPLL